MFDKLKKMTLKELEELKQDIIDKAEKREGKSLPISYLRAINNHIRELKVKNERL
jgi:hypothetical protein